MVLDKDYDNTQSTDLQTAQYELENRLLSEVGLRNILNIDELQDIQNKISRVTGLSMVTVDYKGIPITKETSFCEYCIARRKLDPLKKNCVFSDAYGGLRASMNNSPYIYYCPAGLTDCAIPITFHDQYLGAILLGQVRTEETKELEDLRKIVNEDHVPLSPELKESYDKIQFMELEKIKITADLVLFLVKEMLEKQLLKLIQKKYQLENQQLSSALQMQKIEMQKFYLVQEDRMKADLRPQMMMSVLNSINNLSMIEGASLTNEMICLFADCIRYSFDQNKEFVSLKQEIEHIERYLSIQKHCFDHLFNYEIISHCDIGRKEILSFVLLPFIENSILHGLDMTDPTRKNFIKMEIDQHENEYHITISDNGRGISKDMLSTIMGQDVISFEKKYEFNGLSIANTRRRLIKQYGKEYDISMDINGTSGLKVIVKIPMTK